MDSYVKDAVRQIKEQVGKGRVLCGVSGGVDSTVAAALIHWAVGDQLSCVFVNNGVLRMGEAEQVQEMFKKKLKIDLHYADVEKEFLDALQGVSEPEQKRKIIGRTFIRVFERSARDLMKEKGEFDFLAQGTLYPDVIESVSVKGPSATIKSHHNVGGLPDDMKFKLVEPLRELFKDEVRALGAKLGIPKDCSGASLSRDRDWRFGWWARSPWKSWKSFARPTPSWQKKSKRPVFIIPSGSPSRSSPPSSGRGHGGRAHL